MNKDIYLIGEAYKNQILEASKRESLIPLIKQRVLENIDDIAHKVGEKLLNKSNKTPFAIEFVKLYNKLKKSRDDGEILQILNRMKDISDLIGLSLVMPEALGRYNSSRWYTGTQAKDEENMPNQPNQVKRN